MIIWLGQDIFIPGRKFVISGINVLEVDAELNREEIEAILTDAKNELVDEYSGWSDSGEASTAPMLLGQICHEAWFAPAAAYVSYLEEPSFFYLD